MFPYHEKWMIGLYALWFGGILETIAFQRRRRRARLGNRLPMAEWPGRCPSTGPASSS